MHIIKASRSTRPKYRANRGPRSAPTNQAGPNSSLSSVSLCFERRYYGCGSPNPSSRALMMISKQPRCSLKFYIVITLIRHEENQFRGNVICFSNYFIIGSCLLPANRQREMGCEIFFRGYFRCMFDRRHSLRACASHASSGLC